MMAESVRVGHVYSYLFTCIYVLINAITKAMSNAFCKFNFAKQRGAVIQEGSFGGFIANI